MNKPESADPSDNLYHYTLNVALKKDGTIVQIIDLMSKDAQAKFVKEAVKSYITKYNSEARPTQQYDYGILVVGDFNFDGNEDVLSGKRY